MRRFRLISCCFSLLAACGSNPPPTDPCTPNPCQHGGTCAGSTGAAVCTCISPFAGATCAASPSVTSISVPSPLLSGASGSFSATVTDPSSAVTSVAWSYGDAASFTDSAPTRTGTTLTSTVTHTYAAAGTYTVTATITVGAFSVNKTASVTVTNASGDPCSPNPCQNGGSCTNNAGAAQCACTTPFTGALCATAPSVTSISVPASVTVNADAGFTATISDPGNQVRTVDWAFGDGVSLTDSAPAVAGATVTSTVGHVYVDAGTFSLTASVDFPGPISFNKSVSVVVTPVQANPCSPNPCLNGGTCANQGGVAHCTCASGFTGATCGQHLPTVSSITLPGSATAGTAATLIATVNDPDQLVTTVAWTFGDASTANDTAFTRAGATLTSTVQHTYASAATYTVQAAVTVNGSTSSKTAQLVVSAGAGCTVTSWNVTTPGGGFAFQFSGVTGNNPSITVCKGQTFTFHVSTSTSPDHPFCIWNANDQNSAPGVTNNCINSGDVVWAVPANLTTGGQYMCSVHHFGNTFTVQ